MRRLPLSGHHARGKNITCQIHCLANTLRKISDRLELSYGTARELNHVIDTLPRRRPLFKCEDFAIGGERLSFYFRDVMECIRALYGDPDFASDLVFTPERHYSDPERTCRIYTEMYTGDWWWAVQVHKYTISNGFGHLHMWQTSLELQQPGATVIPIILSSNKTQLTHFQANLHIWFTLLLATSQRGYVESCHAMPNYCLGTFRLPN